VRRQNLIKGLKIRNSCTQQITINCDPFVKSNPVFGPTKGRFLFCCTAAFSIPHICYGHHGQCPYKKFMSSVKFSRLNAKNAYFTLVGHLL